MNVKIVVTARAIIINDGKILLVSNKGEKWVTPGGWIDGFETLEEACKREVYEELGINVNVKHLVYTSEFIQTAENNRFCENINKIEHYFFCEIIGPGPNIRDGKNLWTDTDSGYTAFAKWFGMKDLPNFMLPQEIAQRDIFNDVKSLGGIYLSRKFDQSETREDL